MPKIHFVSPSDQPNGKFRLINWIEDNLQNDAFQNFCCLVAFAKIKPFYKLHESIQQWNARGNSIHAIIGIDHKGTSFQALQYVLANFDEVKILHVDYSTFHPKFYLFYGSHSATVYYGSSNFTSGGLETNFEGGIIVDLDMDLAADKEQFNDVYQSFISISSMPSPFSQVLSQDLLEALKNSNLLLDESKRAAERHPATEYHAAQNTSRLFGDYPLVPAKPIPQKIMKAAAESAGISLVRKRHNIQNIQRVEESLPNTVSVEAPVLLPVFTDGFVIQVIPHHNGEILLSKNAITQNPAFFGFPFTGKTIPKYASNPSYPQRVPDPIVQIRVFDSKGILQNEVEQYALNTIYYEKKAEIRITITPSILEILDVKNITNNYPILVMRNSVKEHIDYELDFYAMGSEQYGNYLAVCNQTLPSGGKTTARKMGWL